MSVITYLRIENFRSIRSVTLEGLDDYVPIVGLNSSGKSNILRALNLFFNGIVDDSAAQVDLSVDHSSHAPQRKKKRIVVTVGLSLGADFNVRGTDDFAMAHGLTDVIFIRKAWSLSPDNSTSVIDYEFGPDALNMHIATEAEVATLQTYVRSVRFVYVPNHARPSDLIRSELEPLRTTLVARLRGTRAYRDSNVPELLEELGNLGDRMFDGVNSAVTHGMPGLGVSASLPSDFADLVFNVGVTAVSDSGVARAPEFEGSGAQSYMLLHILDLADRTRRATGFGWVQASIWAVEEPESFLHAGLRARFSTDMAAYAKDSRRQIFATTHQDEFARVADEVWTATKLADGTHLGRMPAREAIEDAARREITTFRHPLFAFADQPIVIVEGRYDGIYLRSALAAIGRRVRWRLVVPSEVMGDDVGGDGVLGYLRFNGVVLASRPAKAPVIVLRDWEAKDEQKYSKALSLHPYSKCVVADGALSNPELDESWVGIERYLPTSLIRQHVKPEQIGLESGLPGARLTVKRAHLEAAKPLLAKSVEAGGDAGENMRNLAGWLDDQVVAVLDSVPAEAFL